MAGSWLQAIWADGLTMNRPELTAETSFGVARLFRQMGYAPLFELSLKNGRRVDVAGLDQKGRIIFAEVKSSREDWVADNKWQDYLAWCDAFYFAVPESFPGSLLEAPDAMPDTTGLIVADRFEGAILREARSLELHASRRKAVTNLFARASASRLFRLTDPSPLG